MPLPETSADTIDRVLSGYEIGRKLRQLRLRKKIALAELGRHTGLSASMISQLETGRLLPTLATLARLAMVFDVGLDHFFTSRRKQGLFEVVRQGERLRFPSPPDAEQPDFVFEVLAYKATGKPLEAYLAEFPAPARRLTRPHTHPGAELVYVLEGILEIRYLDEPHILEPGDTAYFDSAEPHAYQSLSRRPARALIVSVPTALA